MLNWALELLCVYEKDYKRKRENTEKAAFEKPLEFFFYAAPWQPNISIYEPLVLPLLPPPGP